MLYSKYFRRYKAESREREGEKRRGGGGGEGGAKERSFRKQKDYYMDQD